MCYFISWCKLEPEAQAAWVQAVGSVVALLIAIAVPIVGSILKSRAERQIQKERMLNAALHFFDPLTNLRISLDEFYENSGPEYDEENPLVSIDPYDGDFQSLIPPLVASLPLLHDMGPLAPALRKFLFGLRELDRYFKIIAVVSRTGSPAFMRTNIDDIRERIKEVMNDLDVVLAEIEKAMLEK